MKYISAEQMARIDERAVKYYDLSILQMMENAGRNLARFTSKLNPQKTIVLCGGGNNGGGLVSARYLKIYGFKVEVVLASTKLNPNAKNQWQIVKKMRSGSRITSWRLDHSPTMTIPFIVGGVSVHWLFITGLCEKANGNITVTVDTSNSVTILKERIFPIIAIIY